VYAIRGPDGVGMHFNLGFTATQILWTLTFAAQLVLLVVLLGRERMARYPFFTASIVLFAVRLLTEVLLAGRLPMLTLRATFITLADLASILGLLVVFEIARRAFSSAGRTGVAIGTVCALAIAGTILAFWGPWPTRAEVAVDSPAALLRLMQFSAQKADTLVDLLTVELGLLIVLFGRRYQAGWRSHTQQIAIGLSTVACAWLAVRGFWEFVAGSVHPTTRQEYERVVALGGKLVNANKAVYIAVLIWWIVWLWIDEPGGKAAAAASEAAPEIVEAEPAADAQPTGE
jgi:hypothetical protein